MPAKVSRRRLQHTDALVIDMEENLSIENVDAVLEQVTREKKTLSCKTSSICIRVNDNGGSAPDTRTLLRLVTVLFQNANELDACIQSVFLCSPNMDDAARISYGIFCTLNPFKVKLELCSSEKELEQRLQAMDRAAPSSKT